jgi:hypothetical protein
VLVGDGGEARRTIRAALTDDARFGLIEYLAQAGCEIVATEALARADLLPAQATRRGIVVWNADDALAVAVALLQVAATPPAPQPSWRGCPRIPAPADGKSHKAIRGWGKSLLYFILRNERYIGQMVWNKRQWFRDPITKRRRYRERPETEWIRTEQPELAVVDRETWDRVQARHAENAKQSGSPGRTGHKDHMLSGLLRCGTCGSPMTIVSRSGKNGQRWSNYGSCARTTPCSAPPATGGLLPVLHGDRRPHHQQP